MSDDIQLKWKVNVLDCYPEFSGQKDYVFTAHWDCTTYYNGVSGGPFFGRTFSCTSVPVNSGNFIPYKDLKENDVLNWIFDVIGEESKNIYESGAIKQILDQVSPPIVRPPIPWQEEPFPTIPPQISIQPPSGIAVLTGDSCSITCSVIGQPLNYQWRKDTIDIVGGNSFTLALSGVQTSDEGVYSLKAYNSLGEVISSGCSLSVLS